MQEKQFVNKIHLSTERSYLDRVLYGDKAQCAEIAKKFDKEYWDGERRYGYGGYIYDGRWSVMAKDLIDFYKLQEENAILDIGCGKGYLLYELKKIMPSLKIFGVDISKYAIENSKIEVREFLEVGNASKLKYEDNSFDLVISNSTLHNLELYDLLESLKEIERVKKSDGKSWICVESYRNEFEKVNLLNWQLTCECFFTPKEWRWVFDLAGYTGEYEFIYFL